MSSLLIQLAIAAGIFLAGVVGGMKWHAGQDAIQEVARQENQRAAERLRRQNADTAAIGHEVDKTEIRTQFLTITEKVEHEIQTQTVVYSGVCIAPGGLQQLADAARATGYTGEPGDPVPAASAAK